MQLASLKPLVIDRHLAAIDSYSGIVAVYIDLEFFVAYRYPVFHRFIKLLAQASGFFGT
jgi:hypothetical protein